MMTNLLDAATLRWIRNATDRQIVRALEEAKGCKGADGYAELVAKLEAELAKREN